MFFEDCELRDEVVGLKNETDPSPARFGEIVVGHARNIGAAQQITARSRPVQATNQVQHGGFARAGRSHDCDKGTGIHHQVHATQGAHFGLATEVVALLDGFK
jgi:hypothetical protein